MLTVDITRTAFMGQTYGQFSRERLWAKDPVTRKTFSGLY